MKSFLNLALVAALTFGAAGIAGAQSNASSGSAAGSGSADQKTQALIKEYQQKSSKLKQIQQKALEQNPQLKQEQEDYRDKVKTAISNQGYDMDAGRERLQKLSKRLQSGNLKQSERKDVMQKFQSERQQMTSARQKAMNQPKVKQAGQKLQQDTIAAMKKINPQTEDLIQRLRAIQSQMRSSMSKQSQAAGSSGS